MSPSIREYLQHILAETEYVQNATKGITKESLIADETLKRAVVRSLEIIGEAVKQIPQETRDTKPDIEWRMIRRMRDRLIHAYFGINYTIVWDVVQNYVPELEKTVRQLLDELK